jgi:subfamily B ATP-binding cassette protein MsbA
MIKFLRQLWPFVKPYRSRLVLGLLCGVMFGLLQALLVVLVKFVVRLRFEGRTDFADEIARSHGLIRNILEHLAAWIPQVKAPESKLGLILIICLIPGTMLVRAMFGYLSVYLTNWSALRAVADIRTKLFNHLQNLSLSFFSGARTGDLISRITSDTQTLYGIIGNSLSSLVKDPVTIVTMMAWLFTQQPRLTLISMIVLPACLIPISWYRKKVRKSARAIQGHNSELVTLMHESFTGNRIIKAYNLEDTVTAQFRAVTQKYIGQVMRVVRANEIPSQLTELLGGVGVALVLIYTISFDTTAPSIEDFVSFLLAIVIMYQPIKSLTRMHNQLHQAAAASERVFELLEMQSSVVEPAQPVPLEARHADIHFDNVDFQYGEKAILQNINLTVKAGHLVALVGSTGSGKTTITNLLLRFYDPQSGAVKIGGTDIRNVSTKDLRRQIALVTQETILFHDTIRKNIALGRPDATNAEIEAAARAASAHEFIVQRPEGYDAVVGEKGMNVSGGQRQRIAIARAIVKNAPILVLDEATSALDTETERLVQAELEKLMEGRTTLCIAHRLSTVQKADLIVVFSAGKIVETGTHAELLARGGVYQRLYELQFNG